MAQMRDSRGASSSGRRNTLHHVSSGSSLKLPETSIRVGDTRFTNPVGGQAARNTPMKWVYNSDHTDPVNFGFMTLVPVDSTNPTDRTVPVALPVRRTPKAATLIGSQFTQGSRTYSCPFPFGAPAALKELQEVHSVKPTFPPTPESEYNPGIMPYPQVYVPEASSSNRTSSLSNEGHRHIPFRQSPKQNIPPYPNITPMQEATPLYDLSWQFPSNAESEHSQVSSQLTPTGDDEISQEYLIQSKSSIQGPILRQEVQSQPLKRKYQPSPPISPRTQGLVPRPIQTPASVYDKSKNSSHHLLTSDASAGSTAPSYKRQQKHALQADPIPEHSLIEVSSICWRCQKFATVHVASGMCSPCLHDVNMNTWPSEGGVRLENLESLVLCLLPSHTEAIISGGSETIQRQGSWRIFRHERPHLEYDFNAPTKWDEWTLSDQKARSTTLWGEDFAELANIARRYQQSLRTPNVSLRSSSTVLIAVCDLYNCFVTPTPDIPSFTHKETVLEHIRIVRMCMRDAFTQLQYLALSPSELRERKDWFPSFLSATMLAATAVTFLDILGACPSPLKEMIWGQDWHNRIAEMRHGGYGMLISVLKANTKGVNPLKLDCWVDDGPAERAFIVETPKSYSSRKSSQTLEQIPGMTAKDKRRYGVKGYSPKNRERDILLGQSPAALEGLMALKAFQARFQDDLKNGENMFTKEMYAQAMSIPVGSLWKLFEMQN